MNILLLLPNQLFKNIKYLKEYNIKKVIIYEEPKFFTYFKYHKLKLLYHRITCKYYFKYLKSKKIECSYIDFNKEINYKYITHIIDPIDHELESKYKKKIINLKIIPSQYFTLSSNEIKNNAYIFYKNNRFNHSNFYKWQRIRLNILLLKSKNNIKPFGGKWSFDTENRNKIPNNIKIPSILNIKYSQIEIEDAKKYINKYFSNNYGEMNLIYPINHQESIKWLNDFIKNKLKNFGEYEDASLKNEAFLFHSVLTPMLNIGLLTDWDVLNTILKYKSKIPISSLEGFIRQVIGWRNYVYAIYILAPEIKYKNFFKHTKKISDKWWTGIGIEPIDDIIKNKIIKYAYTHHIERLMYLGSYMLMSQIHPDEVYKYFMEWTIDAYEWVMIPNIYGMSQFADGGIMMKRPYFSSSNYILKMSNYKKGEWCKKWDNLYYSFLKKHSFYFKNSYFYSKSLKYINKNKTIY
jgi:deoxyribodipyrimidine photolyase-related protein